jgi:peroxiredoxin
MTERPAMPQAGQEAPSIDATRTGGGAFSLAAQRGHWAVVYFYPRANTPG